MFLAEFTGFHGASLGLLATAGLAGAAWLGLLLWRWFATFPYLPDAGPAVSDFGAETPALTNLLVHRWNVTRAAMPATLLDLAARRLLAVEQYGDQTVVRAYEERIEGSQLVGFERHILDFVRARVRDRSAPVAALDLGAAADEFWNAFRKLVEKEARDRGLARSRWTNRDRVLIGLPLAAALGLLALSFDTAHLGEALGDSDTGLLEWLGLAGGAWLAVTSFLFTRRTLRHTTSGLSACRHWLGVREYFRQSQAFGDLPAAAVTTWERNLAYAVALGVAHRAAEELPFDIEDPDTAWSRHGGDWHELRVEYPTRFGATQRPVSVLFTGLWQAVLFGGLLFVATPLAAPILVDIGSELRDAGAFSGDNAQFGWVVVGLVGLFGLGVLVLLARFLVGVIWLIRGLQDLAAPEVLEGEIVKLHGGRVAIDDGRADEVVAWLPPQNSPSLARGMIVRIRKTRRLHYVSSIEVLDSRLEFAETEA